ncbi:MAG: SH3 domain-containing protein [Verrucomicrobiota bacterium]|nr:SH3 domain-containing protein [Verrucomicrobiota bacterium]
MSDYDGTELSFKKADRLVVETEESGWFWCVNRFGQRGWVPSNRVKDEGK